jgi:hypothetical protein
LSGPLFVEKIDRKFSWGEFMGGRSLGKEGIQDQAVGFEVSATITIPRSADFLPDWEVGD